MAYLKNRVIVDLPQIRLFLGSEHPTGIDVAWDRPHDFLIRWLAGWLSGQLDGWHRHVLDQFNHSTCLLETIPAGEWANLTSPGRIGRISRLNYEIVRNMESETALRIIAKFPRRKHHSEQTLAEVAHKIAADPILKEALLLGRIPK